MPWSTQLIAEGHSLVVVAELALREGGETSCEERAGGGKVRAVAEVGRAFIQSLDKNVLRCPF